MYVEPDTTQINIGVHISDVLTLDLTPVCL